MLRTVLCVTCVASVYAGAPPPYAEENLTKDVLPMTCGIMKERYQSAECCGADAEKPYIPVLSGTCKSVISVVHMEWNTTYLDQDGASLLAMFGMTQIPPGTKNIEVLRMPDTAGSTTFNWFKNARPSRAGYTHLVDAVVNTFTGDQAQKDAKDDAYAAFWKGDILSGYSQHFEIPVTAVMDVVEVHPSCEAVKLNMAGEGGSLAQNMEFYSKFMKSMSMQVFVPKGQCDTYFAALPGIMSTYTKGKGTVTVHTTGGDHPAVC